MKVWGDMSGIRTAINIMKSTHPRLDGTVEGEASRAVAQPSVDLSGTTTAFLDTPDDERLAATAVTRSKHALDIRRVFLS